MRSISGTRAFAITMEKLTPSGYAPQMRMMQVRTPMTTPKTSDPSGVMG